MLGIAISIWPSRYPRRGDPLGELPVVLFFAAFMAGKVTSSRQNSNAKNTVPVTRNSMVIDIHVV
jgi:hypothetical protein